MTEVHIDFETRSVADLRNCGVHVYAANPTTDVWCLGWAIDDGPVELWTPGQPPPQALQAVAGGALVYAHNAAFELSIWREVMVKRYGWPPLEARRTRCTMVMALAMGLPASLAEAAPAAGLTVTKDMEGNALSQRMGRPRKMVGGEPVWWDVAERMDRLYAYCRQDVEVERQLAKRLLPLSPFEQRLWEIDQRINDRGFQLDVPVVERLVRLVEEQQGRLDAEMLRVTSGFVPACTNVNALAEYLTLKGVYTSSLAKDDVARLLGHDDLPPEVRRALELRQSGSKSSVKKVKAFLNRAGVDGRGRGCFQYNGAHTRRWAGRGPQPQNLPRPTMKATVIADVLDLIEEETMLC